MVGQVVLSEGRGGGWVEANITHLSQRGHNSLRVHHGGGHPGVKEGWILLQVVMRAGVTSPWPCGGPRLSDLT